MKNITLANIAKATGGHYVGTTAQSTIEVEAIETDSRKIARGGLFVAIKGERVDGHNFIDQVIEQGAMGVLSENDLGEQSFPYVVVQSTLQAVKDIAEFYLKQLNIPVVGISGSVGKTSTKEMTYSVLSQGYRVLKTQGNFNNELGLPLTVFRLREGDEMAILEMGISDFGEMHRLAQVARPHTVILTNIGYAHLNNLHDRDGVLKAKTEIFDFLESDACIILNGDDDKLATVTNVRGITPITYGLGEQCDYRATHLKSLGLKGTACTIHTPVGSFDVTVTLPGKHMVCNALAATAAGVAHGLSLQQIKQGIEANESLAGRFNIIETSHYTIIDDCYNASPVSMKGSLEVLQDGNQRRVAILGDMAELGENEQELHASVGRHAATLKLDALYCAGPLTAHLAQAAQAGNPYLEVRHYATRQELASALPSLLHNGDTILVKASHCMQFEQIVAMLQQA